MMATQRGPYPSSLIFYMAIEADHVARLKEADHHQGQEHRGSTVGGIDLCTRAVNTVKKTLAAGGVHRL